MIVFRKTWLVWLFAAAACSPGGPVTNKDDLVLDGEGFRLVYHLKVGAFDVELSDGSVILQRAFSEAETGAPGATEPQLWRSNSDYFCQGSAANEELQLGAARLADIECSGPAGAPDLLLQLAVYAGQPFFTARLEARNPSQEEMRLARLVPAMVEAEERGALFLGTHPAGHRVLEDGSFLVLEFFVDILPGDAPRSGAADTVGFVHGYQRGNSVSNWNHAVLDLESGRSLVAGSLDFSVSSPMCNLSYDPEQALPVRGRTPFTYWSVDFPLLPNGKPLAPGEQVGVGPVFVSPATQGVFDGLERYALAVKQQSGILTWPERAQDNRVPTGWNSWTGSGSSGGYGSSIDEQLMLDNLQAMDDEFSGFGGEWFQIDDGYEPYYGDWDWREDRFPHGSAWLAGEIASHGLKPGVWIAPFQVDEHSQTYASHQADGWFPEQLPFLDGGKPILDLTHPGVQQWLEDRFRRIRADGFRWIKTDFVYYALGAASFHDPKATREEAYRSGLDAIRRGLALGAQDAGGSEGDVFWLSVSMLGPHMGYADSIRPNLDTMPAWEQESADQSRLTAQGLKPTVRTMARRYYWQGRALVFNHDMLFFRAHADPTVPPLTADESRCLLSAMALSGSVAKLGEKIVEMQPGWIADYRTVIPVFGRAARPEDLFRREWPEVWHLPVDPTQGLNTGGAGPTYQVIALFNWGANWDLTENPFLEMPDQAREVSADLAELGMEPGSYVAREFWSGEVLDDVSTVLSRTLQPHSVEVWALRPRLDRPQYLGGNRHLLQGAVEIKALDWDSGDNRLDLRYDAAPGSSKAPFTHRLFFRLPPGWSLLQVSAPDAENLGTRSDGGVLEVSFSVSIRRTLDIRLDFRPPA